MSYKIKFVLYWILAFLTWPLVGMWFNRPHIVVMKAIFEKRSQQWRGEVKAEDCTKAVEFEHDMMRGVWLWVAIIGLAVWK